LFDVAFQLTLPDALAAQLKTLVLDATEVPDLPRLPRLTHLHLVVHSSQGKDYGKDLAWPGLSEHLPCLQVLQTNLELSYDDVSCLSTSVVSLVLDSLSEDALHALAGRKLARLCLRCFGPSKHKNVHESESRGSHEFELDMADDLWDLHLSPSSSPIPFAETRLDFVKGFVGQRQHVTVHDLVLDGTSESDDSALLSHLTDSVLGLSAFHKRLTLDLVRFSGLRSLVLHGVPLELSTLVAVSKTPTLETLVLEYNYTHAFEEPDWRVLTGSPVKFMMLLQVWVGHETEAVLFECLANLRELQVQRRNLEPCCEIKLVSYL
jgi:hypothetical protein